MAAKRSWMTWQKFYGILAASLASGFLVLHQKPPVDPVHVLGFFVLLISAGALVHHNLKRDGSLDLSLITSERLVWMSVLLGILGLQILNRALGMGAHTGVEFLSMAPVVAMALLIGLQLGAAHAVTALTLLALLTSLSGALNGPMAASAWIAGCAAAHLVSPVRRRSHLVRAVGILILIQGLVGASAAFAMKGTPMDVAESAMWSGVSAVGAASIFWLGTALVEKLLGISSDWSLLELSSSDHPLIQDMILKAPGTYAHSMMVAALAENAARSIGANPALCRAMAAFHDVGKLERPSVFIENQTGRNIHDDLAPTYSAQLLAAHVTEGVEIARKHGLPDSIIDGIAQHHGTSLMRYFFHRAHGESGSPEDEAAFRYPGPRPQTREAAILHLADMAEAASRTLNDSGEIKALVASLIRRTQADGQLDECLLTFRDLNSIQESLTRTLCAMRHERIVYPGQETLNAGQDHGTEPVEQAP